MPKNGKQNKPRLGRGLSSLMQVEDDPQSPTEHAGEPTQAVADGTPMQVSVEAIRPNPSQPRRQFGPAALAELAASMKHAGVIQPLIVRPAPGEDGKYELVAGERRLRAAKLAGLDAVPCVLRGDATDEGQAVAALIENIQREDLNPIDRAEAYDAMRNRLGMTQAEVAERLGEDRSTISNHLRLLDLAPPVRDHVREDRLSLGHAKVLAGVADASLQEQLADRCVGHGPERPQPRAARAEPAGEAGEGRVAGRRAAA